MPNLTNKTAFGTGASRVYCALYREFRKVRPFQSAKLRLGLIHGRVLFQHEWIGGEVGLRRRLCRRCFCQARG